MCRTLIFAFLLTSTVQGAEQVVWQIGRPDHSYAEFAFARDYQAYAKAFGARPVVFDVGRSDAGRDWPFIQPGPDDGWSPARAQPRTVRFNLAEAPRGVFTLRIEFADVQQRLPPRYLVAIGDRTGSFQLAPGGGDESLTNPRAGKPQKLELTLPASYLKQGGNEIRLTCIEGSWVQYDAITLLNDKEGSMPPAAIQSVSVRPTPLFIRQGGEVRRAVDVAVATTGPAAGLTLRVEAAGRTFERPLQTAFALRFGRRGGGRARFARPVGREGHRHAQRPGESGCRAGPPAAASGGSTWPQARTPTSAIRTSNPSAPNGIARTSTRPST